MRSNVSHRVALDTSACTSTQLCHLIAWPAQRPWCVCVHVCVCASCPAKEMCVRACQASAKVGRSLAQGTHLGPELSAIRQPHAYSLLGAPPILHQDVSDVCVIHHRAPVLNHSCVIHHRDVCVIHHRAPVLNHSCTSPETQAQVSWGLKHAGRPLATQSGGACVCECMLACKCGCSYAHAMWAGVHAWQAKFVNAHSNTSHDPSMPSPRCRPTGGLWFHAHMPHRLQESVGWCPRLHEGNWCGRRTCRWGPARMVVRDHKTRHCYGYEFDWWSVTEDLQHCARPQSLCAWRLNHQGPWTAHSLSEPQCTFIKLGGRTSGTCGATSIQAFALFKHKFKMQKRCNVTSQGVSHAGEQRGWSPSG